MAKKKSQSAKKVFLTSFLCSLALICTLLAFNMKSISESLGRNPSAFFGTITPQSTVKQEAPAKVQQSFEEYLNETLFIGDSRTNGFLSHSSIPDENILAKNGENHIAARTEKLVKLESGKMVTIAQAVAIKKPVRMIVSFGINGIAFMGKDKFMEEYEALVDELHKASPDTILVIQSILPVSKSREQDDPRMANSKIDQYNSYLKQLADEKGMPFLDPSASLKDSHNLLAKAYDCGDGLHFSEEAYTVLLNYFDEHRA